MRVRTTLRSRARVPVYSSLLAFPLVSLLVAILGEPAQAGPAPIPWRTNFEQAQAEAVARHRPLWVQFTGPWCVFCRRMEHEVFVQSEIIALSRDDFIPVKIRSDERQDLVQRFGIVSLPATVILNPAGRYINRHEGYLDSDRFLGLLFASRPPLDPKDREPGTSAVALAGYDVVNLVSGHGLKPGKADVSVPYDGQVYRFLDTEDRDKFVSSPEKYLPSSHGRCVVSLVDRGVSVAGDPRFGVYYRDHLYFCADAETRKQFAADPDRYADADVADAGHCPHCRAEQNVLVRGQSQYSLTHQGRRYLFPDALHMEAFRSSIDKLIR